MVLLGVSQDCRLGMYVRKQYRSMYVHQEIYVARPGIFIVADRARTFNSLGVLHYLKDKISSFPRQRHVLSKNMYCRPDVTYLLIYIYGTIAINVCIDYVVHLQ